VLQPAKSMNRLTVQPSGAERSPSSPASLSANTPCKFALSSDGRQDRGSSPRSSRSRHWTAETIERGAEYASATVTDGFYCKNSKPIHAERYNSDSLEKLESPRAK